MFPRVLFLVHVVVLILLISKWFVSLFVASCVILLAGCFPIRLVSVTDAALFAQGIVFAVHTRWYQNAVLVMVVAMIVAMIRSVVFTPCHGHGRCGCDFCF